MATVFHPVTPDIAGKIMKVKELLAVSEVDKPLTKVEVHAQRRPDPGYYIESRAAERLQIPPTRHRAPSPTQSFSVRASTLARPTFSTTASPRTALEPTPLSDSQYHDLADAYLQNLLESLEALADVPPSPAQSASRDAPVQPFDPTKIDAEYSQGTLEIRTPMGTYVINKQPPNRQIWLSAPVSGPKRFDWVEEGPQGGRWVYLRDGTGLSELLREEIGVLLGEESGEG